ncbi:MAG: YfbR-like 5'-deoxynucleotidase [Bacteroidales bacterium]
MTKFIPLNIQRRQRTVERCSLAPKIRSYDLMQHSFGVLSIYLDLINIFNLPTQTQDKIETVLRHDLLEVLTGDLPYNIKNLNDTVSTMWESIENEVAKKTKCPAIVACTDANIKTVLSVLEYKVFKLADMLDLLFYCTEEASLGNDSDDMLAILNNSTDISIKLIKDLLKTLDVDYRDNSLKTTLEEYLGSFGMNIERFLRKLQQAN